MFKKLKDKIAEEVKISPQRMQALQQFTQAMTDKLQQSGAPPSDDGLFSISEDDGKPLDAGFTNVPLHVSSSTPELTLRARRNSTSSVGSDVSFLPHYESSLIPYHLQSDLDVSASEVEDNASQQSSSLGHVSKEQVHLAFQKAQMKYHKYRGQYTDLAAHYRELERENAKIRAVLVDSQDKSIRRVAELREQCALGQRAKADLEAALRVELEEKLLVIATLKQKVQLLQAADVQPTSVSNGVAPPTPDLHEKVAEYKASSIVSRERADALQRELADAQRALREFDEREKRANLAFARSKMELHAELQQRDQQLAQLQRDADAHGAVGGGLKAQNANLIDKCDALKARNHELEAELLKTAQYKLEIDDLRTTITELRQVESARGDEVRRLQEETKQSLVALQERMRDTLAGEYEERALRQQAEFEARLAQVARDGDSLQQAQAKLVHAEEALSAHAAAQAESRDALAALRERNAHLEANYVGLMAEGSARQAEVVALRSQLRTADDERNSLAQRLRAADGDRDALRGAKQQLEALTERLAEETRLRLEAEAARDAVDEAQRASLDFHERELQRVRAKNEKLTRRLDETLVALAHCADLSASTTEVEYLRNVLYNYMLGKESLVLARVIAAVCKFDRAQTDAVLKHEQHKQTLLGQLGIL